jgi:hypothetical protein
MNAETTRYEALYDRYIAAASTPDPERRLRLLRECAAEDLQIVGPFPYDVRGVVNVSRQLGEVAAAMPDGVLTLRRTSPIDAHHEMFRAYFANCSSDGTQLSTGMHVVEVRDDQIVRILVFVPDRLPAPVEA